MDLELADGHLDRWTDRPEDGRLNGWTDRQMDGRLDAPRDGQSNIPSYRDAWTHLKRKMVAYTEIHYFQLQEA